MKEQDYFVLAVALLATVLAVSSGWLRYDNADDTEETSELWYDTGLILGVLYVVAVIVIYFAQTSHEMYQKLAHEGPRSAIYHGANRIMRAASLGSTEDAVHSAGTLGQTVQAVQGGPSHIETGSVRDLYPGQNTAASDIDWMNRHMPSPASSYTG